MVQTLERALSDYLDRVAGLDNLAVAIDEHARQSQEDLQDLQKELVRELERLYDARKNVALARSRHERSQRLAQIEEDEIKRLLADGARELKGELGLWLAVIPSLPALEDDSNDTSPFVGDNTLRPRDLASLKRWLISLVSQSTYARLRMEHIRDSSESEDGE